MNQEHLVLILLVVLFLGALLPPREQLVVLVAVHDQQEQSKRNGTIASFVPMAIHGPTAVPFWIQLAIENPSVWA